MISPAISNGDVFLTEADEIFTVERAYARHGLVELEGPGGDLVTMTISTVLELLESGAWTRAEDAGEAGEDDDGDGAE